MNNYDLKTNKEILIDVLSKMTIVEDYKQYNLDYDTKRNEILNKIADLELVKNPPIQPYQIDKMTDVEMFNFINQNGMTPNEKYQEDLKAYTINLREFTKLRQNIINKYKLEITPKHNINFFLIKCKSDLDYLEVQHDNFVNRNSITKKELLTMI